MIYLILGFAALLFGLFAVRLFAQADPVSLARHLRLVFGFGALGFALLLLVRGLIPIAVPLGALGWWFVSEALGRKDQAESGGASRISTRHLDMELDHATGAMRGRIREGRYEDRDLASVPVSELASLWAEWRQSDRQSADLLEAYLDRTQPNWREEGAAKPGGPQGKMSVEEARSVLGVAADATGDDIRRAHHALMMKVHPDLGGSTYLAAKINEAKDVLLRDAG